MKRIFMWLVWLFLSVFLVSCDKSSNLVPVKVLESNVDISLVSENVKIGKMPVKTSYNIGEEVYFFSEEAVEWSYNKEEVSILKEDNYLLIIKVLKNTEINVHKKATSIEKPLQVGNKFAYLILEQEKQNYSIVKYVENKPEDKLYLRIEWNGLSLKLPDTLKDGIISSISNDVFNEKGIEELTLPKFLSKIGERAFANNRIKTLTMPSLLENIDKQAFAFNSIREVRYEENLPKFAEDAFVGNIGIDYIKEEKAKVKSQARYLEFEEIDDGYRITGFSKTQKSALSLEIEFVGGKLDIPSSFFGKNITEIGGEAFENKYIKELIIPKTIRKIGESAFYRNNLTKLSIPSSVKIIEEGAFFENTLEDIVLESDLIIGDIFDNNGENRNIEFTFSKLEKGRYILNKERKIWEKF